MDVPVRKISPLPLVGEAGQPIGWPGEGPLSPLPLVGEAGQPTGWPGEGALSFSGKGESRKEHFPLPGFLLVREPAWRPTSAAVPTSTSLFRLNGSRAFNAAYCAKSGPSCNSPHQNIPARRITTFLRWAGFGRPTESLVRVPAALRRRKPVVVGRGRPDQLPDPVRRQASAFSDWAGFRRR